MIDSMFEGMTDWFAENIPLLLDSIAEMLLKGIQPDMTVMLAYFPFLATAYPIFVWVGVSLITISMIFGLLRTFGGPILDDVETPLPIVLRGLLFIFMTINIHHICNWAMRIAKIPFNAMWNLQHTSTIETPSASKMFDNFEANFDNGGGVGMILAIVFIIIIFFQYFKTLLETVERFVIMGILTFIAPLAAGLGGSRSTANVFKSWVKMFGSSMFMMTLNIWFIRGFSSSTEIYYKTLGVVEMPSGELVGSTTLWMFAVIAYLKVAQNIDSIIQSLGLSTAQTGRGLMAEAMSAGTSLMRSYSDIAGRGGGRGRGGAGAGLTRKSMAMTRGAEASAAGIGAIAGEKVTDMRKNKGGSVAQSTLTSANGQTTQVRKTNLNEGQTPKGPHYVARDSSGVPWAYEATGKNAGLHMGPQFGEASKNNAFQFSDDPKKYGQAKASELAETYRDTYQKSLASGMSTDASNKAAYQATRDKVANDTRQMALDRGEAISFADRKAESAAQGFDKYMIESNQIFDGNLPNGAMIENDAQNAGHLKITGTNEHGEATTQDMYLASAYEQPQGAHSVVTDKDGNQWYSMDQAQIDPSAAHIPEYFTETQMPELQNALDGNFIESIDSSRAADGIMYANTIEDVSYRDEYGVAHETTEAAQYQILDATRYRPPQGDYQTVNDINGHSYYLSKGEESITSRSVKGGDGSPVYDDKGSPVTEKVVKFKHSRPNVAAPPKKRL